ncbi:MAG TPA: serpin family protein [Jatrophihabitans sp.]|nr:serpin family protein [Jatrophihabitans sp.]
MLVATGLLAAGCASTIDRQRESPGGPVRTAARMDGAVQLVADARPAGGGQPAAVVAAEQRLSLALLRKVDGSGNVSTSPASLYIALAMLENGARGRTQAQIASGLQADGLSPSDQNAGLAALTDELASAASRDHVTLQSANSVWQQRGFPIRKQFLETLAAYYRTGVWQVDFAGNPSGASHAINDWTSQQTHGKIRKLFDGLDRSTVLVLANAVYFHAAWATPFVGAETAPRTFTTASGQQVQAQFMSGGSGLQVASTDAYQAVQLPYRGGRFAALAIMPRRGSLRDFVRSATPASVQSIASGLRPADGAAVLMPRFTTTSTLDLVPALKSLGMTDAFRAADLSALSSRRTRVSQVVQRVYLGVGEAGTTAAAVTGIAIAQSAKRAASLTISLDRPFLFLVRDTKTGMVLFASEIQDPTAG